MLTQAGVPKAPNTKALLPHKGTAVIQTHTSNDAPSTPPAGSSDMMPITLPTEMKSRMDRKNGIFPTTSTSTSTSASVSRRQLFNGMCASERDWSILIFTLGEFALVRTDDWDNCYDILCYCYRTWSIVYTTCIDPQFGMGWHISGNISSKLEIHFLEGWGNALII